MSSPVTDSLRRTNLRLQQRCHDAENHVERLLAENQRHRDALELIAALPRTLDVSGPRIARAALDGTPSAAE